MIKVLREYVNGGLESEVEIKTRIALAKEALTRKTCSVAISIRKIVIKFFALCNLFYGCVPRERASKRGKESK